MTASPAEFAAFVTPEPWRSPPDLTGTPAERSRAAQALSRDTSVGQLSSLARDPSVEVRSWAALNPRTPVGSLRALAADRSWRVRQQAARNSALPREQARGLMADPSDEVRTAALASASASVDDLVEAALRDPSVAVRRFASWRALTRLPAHLGVAPGNRTAIALLRTTAWWELTSRSSEVRAVLAAHPN